jgi:hypothetical protein
MTRSTLRRTLRRIYLLLIVVLGIAFIAKIADHIPFLAGTGAERLLKDAYEFVRDMSLLIATGGVAFVANVYQKRASFIDALKEEWRDIIAAKSVLFTYTQLERPTLEQYLETFCTLSETIDNMRSVYQNVGETADLIGLYPYAPLHDMRRALQTLDPRKAPDLGMETRNLARDAILQSFYALRETFLEELDLEAPDHPLLPSGARRTKASGATQLAKDALSRQQAQRSRLASPADPRIDALLASLRAKEETTAKPWRQPVAEAEGPVTAPLPDGRGA